MYTMGFTEHHLGVYGNSRFCSYIDHDAVRDSLAIVFNRSVIWQEFQQHIYMLSYPYGYIL